ncbi:hypothetical protein J6590_037385 [Homalodisca vitripennis]|nr:hypothetical protein J6590_037385 [Homalodisca vitripennis]
MESSEPGPPEYKPEGQHLSPRCLDHLGYSPMCIRRCQLVESIDRGDSDIDGDDNTQRIVKGESNDNSGDEENEESDDENPDTY